MIKNNIIPFVLGIVCTISLGAATSNISYLAKQPPKFTHAFFTCITDEDKKINTLAKQGWIVDNIYPLSGRPCDMVIMIKY